MTMDEVLERLYEDLNFKGVVHISLEDCDFTEEDYLDIRESLRRILDEERM